MKGQTKIKLSPLST